MPLRKSPILTPALLAANRSNAQKSTGPSTRRGKAQSCLNRLKTGQRPGVYRGLWLGLLHARPGAVGRMADALLTRERAAHPLFAEVVHLARWAEDAVATDERFFREFAAPPVGMAGANAGQEPAEVKAGSTLTLAREIGQSEKMLDNNVRSRKVIESTRNNDIMSRCSTDILSSLTPVLTEKRPLGVTKVTFAMRFGRQCWGR